MTDGGQLCRVLTHCTINGQACVAGDTVELAEPQRGFLIAHRMVALVPSREAPPPEPDPPPNEEVFSTGRTRVKRGQAV